MVARRPFAMFPGRGANVVRGRFGMALRNSDRAVYDRLFAPRKVNGPSGLQDSPRPFALRVRDLEGLMLMPGQRYEIGFNLFDILNPPFESIRDALCAGVLAECTAIDGLDLLRLKLDPAPGEVSRVRVRFLAPTAIGPADRPEFGVLLARIRDRVSNLRALYGNGPLQVDFRAMGDRAKQVRMIRCEVREYAAERISRNTGLRHAFGGFVGEAEYEGELAEFLPYLEAARWTGVGRYTVWGNGEIDWEII